MLYYELPCNVVSSLWQRFLEVNPQWRIREPRAPSTFRHRTSTAIITWQQQQSESGANSRPWNTWDKLWIRRHFLCTRKISPAESLQQLHILDPPSIPSPGSPQARSTRRPLFDKSFTPDAYSNFSTCPDEAAVVEEAEAVPFHDLCKSPKRSPGFFATAPKRKVSHSDQEAT